MPRIEALFETALYVDDMARAVFFFETVLGLPLMEHGERVTAFEVSRQGVLLIFKKGASVEDMPEPAGIVPGHDGTGPVHMAFAIAAESYEPWLSHLMAHNVKLRGEMLWQRGGRSIYFRGPGRSCIGVRHTWLMAQLLSVRHLTCLDISTSDRMTPASALHCVGLC